MNNKASYESLDAYAADFPEVKQNYPWLAGLPWEFVRLENPELHNHLPGGYLRLATVFLTEKVPQPAGKIGQGEIKDQKFQVYGWRVMLGGNDDGDLIRDFHADQEMQARALQAKIKASAPFSWTDAATIFFSTPTSGHQKTKPRQPKYAP